MKIWEVMETLRSGQRVKSESGNLYELQAGTLYLVIDDKITKDPCTLDVYYFKINYELIPQFIPFEEALKAYKEGKQICCKSEKYGKVFYGRNAPQSATSFHIEEEILEGKWWVVE